MTKIDTTEYTTAHGTTPKGYGLWVFNLGRDGSWTTTQYTGSYADAKRRALREARSLKCDAVTVGS
jgi:hypothetical protein